MTMTDRHSAATAYPAIREDPRLERDAADLHGALSELIRVCQFRDRDRICRHDLSVTQCHALEVIGEAGTLSMNELAARLFLDKSTTSRVVDSLERKQFARREANPADRRSLVLSVTDEGHALLQACQAETPRRRPESSSSVRSLPRPTALRVALDLFASGCGLSSGSMTLTW